MLKWLLKVIEKKKAPPRVLDRMSSGLLYQCLVCKKDLISSKTKINYLHCQQCKLKYYP